MATCFECGEEYSSKRAKLGFNTCLACGEEKAKLQSVAKSQRLAPLFNKGAYQYITDGNNLLSLGKKV